MNHEYDHRGIFFFSRPRKARLNAWKDLIKVKSLKIALKL